MAVAGLSATIYVDHNVESALILALRSQGYDVVVPIEIGMAQATDEAHLERAARERRLLISHDLSDFPILAADWYRQGLTHSGILLAEQPPLLSIKVLIARVLVVLDSRSAQEFENEVLWI